MNKDNKIKVLIVDDHAVVRLGLSTLLGYQEDLTVVGEADDGESAVRLSQETKPDVVIMDLVMPGVDGVAATRRIREMDDSVKILILTIFGTSVDVARAIAAGANGAIMKDASNEDILSAIRTIATGKSVLSPEIEKSIKDEPVPPELTQRQLEILQSVTRGLSNPEIAKQFGITGDGAKAHLKIIFSKLGAANRSEAITIAMRKHLLKS